ncbi:MAG TPA: hypothetical protein VFS43_01520 [Polyangiaceae bacterium]|nr:hypothetical protein [Polyangiaceae bacterium]
MAVRRLGEVPVGELIAELERGAKLVVYEYTISVVVLTFKRGSDVFLVPAGEGSVGPGVKYTLLSLVAGWWGIPWGPIYTVMSLVTNLGGGKDVTAEVRARLGAAAASAGAFGPGPSR